MAAGQGFKTFATGDVLSAADVNGYLMQGVLVFADSAERDAEITSPEEGQFAYLKDTNVTTYYTGSVWANLDTTGMTNPMTTTGDTIYSSSGSTPARLGIGTAGQFLAVNSGATAPEWVAAPGGGFNFTQIASTSMSGSSTISFTGLTSNYLFLAIEAATVTSNGGNLYVELNGSTASDYAFAGYRINNNGGSLGVVNYRNTGSTPVVSFLIGEEIYTTDGLGNINPYSGTFSLVGCSGTSYKNGNIIGGGFNSTSFQRQIQRSIYYKNTTAVTSLDLKISTSTFSGGTAILYGA